MITASRSIVLAVLTADCVPVLILDPIRKAIGIAHAGWRGMLRAIASGTILKMRDTFGTEPADCLVALGPSIGPCCYTVGADVSAQFQHAFGSAVCDAENRIDLREAARIQLAGVGVEEHNISSIGACTACNLALFYSYRAEGGRTGRMMSVISITDP
jgi:YfiH family protein